MGYGVIGSPTGSGPVSLGSSPGTPAVRNRQVSSPAGFLFLTPTGGRSSRSPRGLPGPVEPGPGAVAPARRTRRRIEVPGRSSGQAPCLGGSAPAAGAAVAAAAVAPLVPGQPVQDQQ